MDKNERMSIFLLCLLPQKMNTVSNIFFGQEHKQFPKQSFLCRYRNCHTTLVYFTQTRSETPAKNTKFEYHTMMINVIFMQVRVALRQSKIGRYGSSDE